MIIHGYFSPGPLGIGSLGVFLIPGIIILLGIDYTLQKWFKNHLSVLLIEAIHHLSVLLIEAIPIIIIVLIMYNEKSG